jgi:hypothetical protein
MKKQLFTLIFSLFVLQGILYAQEKVKRQPIDDDDEEVDGAKCGGTERWYTKVLADANAAQINLTPKATTIDSLVNIATPATTTVDTRIAGLEYQTYSVVCNITQKRNESDNDYHLVLSDGTNTMIGEVPDPTCAVASTSAHVNEYIAARNWVNTYIGTAANLNINIAPVLVTGVAFLDPPHGQTGAAKNNLEIHSILKLEFVSTTSVNLIKDAALFTVSVSPTSFSEFTTFHVVSTKLNLGVCELEIWDLNGNKVQNLNLPVNNNKEINFTFHRDKLSTGMYIYRITNDGGTLYEGKIIVQ